MLARLKDIQSLHLQQPVNDLPTEIYGGTRFLDYSQFRPRGHYTKSPELRNYFRCQMWLGRADTGWNVLSTDMVPGLDSDDRRELRDAVLLLQLVRRTGNWERLQAIDHVLAFLVGNSDSLNVFRLEPLLDAAGIHQVGDLVDGSQVGQLQEAIRHSQAARQWIRSQVIVSDPSSLYQVKPPATFQMFGQRFAIDSYVLSHVVYDSVIFQGEKRRRMMPSGLDVMATFGNPAAVPLLESELRKWHYSANLLAGRKFVEQQDRAYWNRNLYSLWLDCLTELDSKVVDRPHVPQAMQTRTWQMKQLQTQLASWSQLRHDTVLYTKQSYTGMPGCEYPDGYVEPYPEFYAKVQSLAARAAELIADTHYESAVATRDQALRDIHHRHWTFFTTMGSHIGQLETLARKELAAESFTDSERQFIARTISHQGRARFGSGSRPTYDGWYTELLYQSLKEEQFTQKSYTKWNTTIVDLHTDPESKQVLEVGVGDLNLCVIAIDNQDDRMAFVGPVFSYYEFLQPAEQRLTDQEWDRRLRMGKRPSRPPWTESFVASPKRRPKYGTTVTSKRLGDTATLRVRTRGKRDLTEESTILQLTDTGLATLARVPTIRTLDLARSRVTDQGLAQLRRLKNLRNLNLSSTRIDGSGFASLAEAQWLRVLILHNTQVSDEALARIKDLPRLESLDLSGTRVTNGSIESLREMANLRELNVKHTAIDNVGIEQLQAALPKCMVAR